MATFNVNVNGSFVNGTAAGDTFNLTAGQCTVLGLDGDDTFTRSNNQAVFSLDGGAGNDSFNFTGNNNDELSSAAAPAMTRCSSLPAAETTCPAMPVTTGSVSVAGSARQPAFSTAVTAMILSAQPHTPIRSLVGPGTTPC